MGRVVVRTNVGTNYAGPAYGWTVLGLTIILMVKISGRYGGVGRGIWAVVVLAAVV